MRTGMVVHEGEAGADLIALGVEGPRPRGDAIVPVTVLHDLDAHALRRDHPRNVSVELFAERIYLALLHQSRGLRDHVGGDVIQHPALVVLPPTTPVTALAPLARHRPGRRLVR